MPKSPRSFAQHVALRHLTVLDVYFKALAPLYKGGGNCVPPAIKEKISITKQVMSSYCLAHYGKYLTWSQIFNFIRNLQRDCRKTKFRILLSSQVRAWKPVT